MLEQQQGVNTNIVSYVANPYSGTKQIIIDQTTAPIFVVPNDISGPFPSSTNRLLLYGKLQNSAQGILIEKTIDITDQVLSMPKNLAQYIAVLANNGSDRISFAVTSVQTSYVVQRSIATPSRLPRYLNPTTPIYLGLLRHGTR